MKGRAPRQRGPSPLGLNVHQITAWLSDEQLKPGSAEQLACGCRGAGPKTGRVSQDGPNYRRFNPMTRTNGLASDDLTQVFLGGAPLAREQPLYIGSQALWWESMAWAARISSKGRIDRAGRALLDLSPDDPSRDEEIAIVDNWRSWATGGRAMRIRCKSLR